MGRVRTTKCHRGPFRALSCAGLSGEGGRHYSISGEILRNKKQYYEALEKTTAGNVAMNERQVKMVNRLWDGFEGKLTTAKWAKIRKS